MFAKQCEKNGITGTKPFINCSFPMDMSAEQKCLNIGGGCKVATHFCTKCSLTSSDLHYYWEGDYKAKLCNVCDHMNNSNNEKSSFRCMHKNVNDQIEIDMKRVNLSMILEERNDDSRENELENKPHLLFDPSMHNKFSNPYHIDFDHVNYNNLEEQESNNDVVLKDVQVFRDLINSEYSKIRMPLINPKTKSIYCFKDKVLKLKNYLLESKIIKNLRDAIDRYDMTSDDYLFAIEKAIPCVLHLENRINEKIITIIIVEGLRNRTSGRELDKYVKNIEHLFNNAVMCKKNGE